MSDDARALGIEIGRTSDTFHRIRISSTFGIFAVFATDGHLPWRYGREVTGYEVANLDENLARAKAARLTIFTRPYTADGRNEAIMQFPVVISRKYTRFRRLEIESTMRDSFTRIAVLLALKSGRR